MEKIKKTKLDFITLIKAISPSISAIIFFGLFLFIPAGTISYWNAWLFIGIIVVSYTPIQLYFAINDRKLFEKRGIRFEKNKLQQAYLLLSTLSLLSTLVVSGFDYRFRWSHVPIFFTGFFSFVLIFGFILLFLVMKQNSYASRTLEIQEEQKVIDTGLYSVVRHPMYLANTIMFLFSPLVLASWYAFIPVIFIPFFLTQRIKYEETMLQNYLPGYTSYTKKVKYRLIPFLW